MKRDAIEKAKKEAELAKKLEEKRIMNEKIANAKALFAQKLEKADQK